jgi:hypothetical protein
VERLAGAASAIYSFREQPLEAGLLIPLACAGKEQSKKARSHI